MLLCSSCIACVIVLQVIACVVLQLYSWCCCTAAVQLVLLCFSCTTCVVVLQLYSWCCCTAAVQLVLLCFSCTTCVVVLQLYNLCCCAAAV